MAETGTAANAKAELAKAAPLLAYFIQNPDDRGVPDKQEILNKLIEVAHLKMQEIQANASLSTKEKDALINRLRGAIAAGTPSALSMTIASVSIQEKIDEMDRESDEPGYVLLQGQYGLNEPEMKRVRTLSKRVNTSDMNSIRAFADAMVDPDLPPQLRDKQVDLFSKAIHADPSIVENHNKATPQARAETMAAYVAAQRDFKEVAKDPHFESIKDVFARADRMGLEAHPKMQEMLRQARENPPKIDPAQLKAEMEVLIKAQLEKYRETMAAARSYLPPEEQEILKTIGEGELRGTNRAIVKLARDTFPKLKDPNYVMNKQEEVAMSAYLLTKEIIVTRMLGDTALTKGVSLERVTGTEKELAERSQAAYDVIKKNMPPELANIPDAILKERIKQTLIEADERKMKVADLDKLSGREAYAFSAGVNEDTIEATRAANRSALNKIEHAAIPSLTKLGVSGGTQVAENGSPGGGKPPHLQARGTTPT